MSSSLSRTLKKIGRFLNSISDPIEPDAPMENGPAQEMPGYAVLSDCFDPKTCIRCSTGDSGDKNSE